MKTQLTCWVTAACLASMAGCATDDMPTEGALLMSTAAPLDVVSVAFSVVCEAGSDETPSAEGELEIVGMDPSTGGGAWEGFVDALPPGDCTVTFIAADEEGQPICTAVEMVPIAAGELAEPTIPLFCNAAS